jgi:hypothetical protein
VGLEHPNGWEIFDNTIYNGDRLQTVRRFAGPYFPLREDNIGSEFGGPHVGVCQFVFADGSVHAINIEINPPRWATLPTGTTAKSSIARPLIRIMNEDRLLTVCKESRAR